MPSVPKAEELSLCDMILIEKMVRIIKDNPRERMLLLKACRKDYNIEYKGDHKDFYAWQEKLEHKLDELIQEKIIDEDIEREFKQELNSGNNDPAETVNDNCDENRDGLRDGSYSSSSRYQRYQEIRKKKLTEQIETILVSELNKKDCIKSVGDTGNEEKECYILFRKDLGYAIWFFKDKTEHDRITDLHDCVIYYNKPVSQYGFHSKTGEFNPKLFPVTKNDAQLEGIRSDVDTLNKAISELNGYKAYLARKYNLDLAEEEKYKEQVYYLLPSKAS
ncbi:MAG: hypothetical protein M3044_14300 [Thermoproteota archaeon]|nr:hypothetical protein [Thermoproteota archaeon]